MHVQAISRLWRGAQEPEVIALKAVPHDDPLTADIDRRTKRFSHYKSRTRAPLLEIGGNVALRLPSRYEDLETAFRGRLQPNPNLIELVKQAFSSMEISGGIRFLPILGSSGSGKSCAALEIGTHLPELFVDQLPREAIDDSGALRKSLADMHKKSKGRRLVAVIDQYEEVASQRTAIPSAFVETISLIDRDREYQNSTLFIWLTTSAEFRDSLATATSRNRRILLSNNFELFCPKKADWPPIIEETFRFHNNDKDLSDYEVLLRDLQEISDQEDTIGAAIESTGDRLAKYNSQLHDMSTYQVIMLWPVTDGLRINRIQQFTDPRQGYKLEWSAWFRQLNLDDQQQLPVKEYNRARLYFDMRVVPIAAADLYDLCKELDNDNFKPGRTYLERLEKTHFFSVASGKWNPDNYAPLRERRSIRAEVARNWYTTVTNQPTKIGQRIAKCLSLLGLTASYEQTITSPHGSVRADVLIDRSPIAPANTIVEIKAFSSREYDAIDNLQRDHHYA